MPGSIDARGVWQYAEDDPISPFSDFMNLGQESISDALEALRLQTTSSPSIAPLLPSAPWVAPSSTYSTPALAKRNGMVHLTSGLIIRSTALTVVAGTSYQVANVSAGLVASGDWLPTTEVYGTGVIFANSATPQAVYVAILPTGVVLFVPSAGATFGAGGATNSLRIPTITWPEP